MKTYFTYNPKLFLLIATLCISLTAIAQPVANFNTTSVSGCTPLIVQFTDNSSGSPTSWAWDFGNGSVSTQKNPVTTFINPGIYNIKLTVSNSLGTNSIIKTGFITVYDNPIVKFTASDTVNCIPFTTKFTDQSTTVIGSIVSWVWDFDDGTGNISSQHPNHLYSEPGNFNITLQVTNSGGCTSSLSKLAYIKAADSIRTQFIFSKPVKCKPPETINFFNNTVGPSLLTYSWDFGDGTSSNTSSPAHTYNNSGIFSVKLISTNSIGCRDTLTLKDTLIIKNIQSVINSSDTVCVNYSSPFVNATIPAPLSSKWVFSDATSSFGSVTAKAWNTPGDYTVNLVSNYMTCSDSITKNIKVLASPTINFTVSDSVECRAPFNVSFTDLTSGLTNWLWDFGDGNSSNQQNPSHTFTAEGEYNVKLSATSSAGCTTSRSKFNYIRVSKPKINIDLKEGGGCIPYEFRPGAYVSSPDGISSYLWNFGNNNTSGNISPLEIYTDSGTYDIKLTVTSTEGCMDSLVMPAGVRTGNRPVVNFGISNDVVCPGTNVQFTDSSRPADRWLWKFGGGGSSELKNPQHDFSDTGKMSVKLLAWNNGCVDSLTKPRIITVLPGLARFRPQYNCNNKLEVFFKDSSILPETWLWNFGDGNTSNMASPTHVFSNYQNYSVTLTTTNGQCTNTGSIRVRLVNEEPDFEVTKNKLCKYDSVIFYFKNINKNNVAKYIWDFGDGYIDSASADSVVHTYSNTGIFSVSLSVIDIKGCIETEVKTNFIEVYSPKAGFSVNNTGGCLNKPLFLTDTSNAQTSKNIAMWIWDFGDGQTQTFTSQPENPLTHIYTNTGYYYPSLKIIDSVGCADSFFNASPVNIYQPVANFFSPNFNTCINDTLIIRNPSTGTMLTYLWSFGDGTVSTDSLPIKTYSANGNYTVKLLITDIAGCTDSVTKLNYVRVRDVSASFNTDDSVGFCVPFQAHFFNTSDNAISQIWDFGDGGFSTTANPSYTYTEPGTYIVKLTSKRTGNCISRDSVKIIIKAPVASLSYTPVNGCGPLNVLFTVTTSDTVSYIWDFNDGGNYSTTTAFTNYTYLHPGSFLPSVVIKDSSGCIVPLVGTDTIKIFSTNVNFNATDSTICLGTAAYFFDSSVSGSTISNYNWDFGDGSFSTLQNPVHYYSQPGSYSVKLLVTTTYGCTDSLIKTDHIKVFIKPEISISGNNARYCGESLITFNGNVSTTDTSVTIWNWNFGNGQNSSLQNPVVQQYDDTGNYNIQLIMRYGSGCADTAFTNVTILPVPETFAGNDSVICMGNTLQLQATGADDYIWQPSAYLNCNNCSNPVSNAPDNILYIVTGLNTAGCEKTDSINITVTKPFTLSQLTNSSICKGESIYITVSGADNYSWSPSAGLNSNNTAAIIATPGTSTTYTVTGYDQYNCFSDTVSVFIEVYPLPQVNAGSDIILNAGKSTTLTPQYSSDIINWLWTPATALSCTNCAKPVTTPANGMQYKIFVTNNYGCIAQDSIVIQLKCDRTNIYLPTAFSPNGINKIFHPLTPSGALTFIITSFKIYNRLGQLVFQNANFSTSDASKGWNGKYKGVDAAAGAYVYTIEFVCDNKQVVNFSGNILLLR